MQLYHEIIGYGLCCRWDPSQKKRRIERDARPPNILYTSNLRQTLNHIVSDRTGAEGMYGTINAGARSSIGTLCCLPSHHHDSRSGPGLWSHPFLPFWIRWLLRRGWKRILTLSITWRIVIISRRCRRRPPPMVGDSLRWWGEFPTRIGSAVDASEYDSYCPDVGRDRVARIPNRKHDDGNNDASRVLI